MNKSILAVFEVNVHVMFLKQYILKHLLIRHVECGHSAQNQEKINMYFFILYIVVQN